MMKYIPLAVVLALGACNNYGLLDKLANPGLTTETYTNNYYIFVSSWITAGDMSNSPYPECASFPGADRADCQCTKAAIANGLRKSSTSVFRAWLSQDATPTGTDADAKCRVQALPNGCTTTGIASAWYNTQGQAVVNDYNQFTTAAFANAVRYDELKADHGPDLVWTATTASGAAATNDCTNWGTADAVSVGVGNRTSNNGNWTDAGSPQACNTGQRIYCVAAP